MLPLSLLKTAQGRPILIELKTGDTYNGTLVDCDNWMNLNLREVVHTSKDGAKFWKMDTCYVRGSQIKYLRMEEDIIDKVPRQQSYRGGRGGRGGRGRGRGGYRGGRGGRGGNNSRGRGKFRSFLEYCTVEILTMSIFKKIKAVVVEEAVMAVVGAKVVGGVAAPVTPRAARMVRRTTVISQQLAVAIMAEQSRRPVTIVIVVARKK